MIDRDYSNRILFMLNFKSMSGYQLSKNIRNTGGQISNGTLFPILNKLVSNGLIVFKAMGNKKIYRLTEKGKNYVQSLRDIGDELRKKIIVDSIDKNMLYFDILSDLEDSRIIKEVLNQLGGELIELIRVGFRLERDGRSAELDALRENLRNILEAV